MTIHTSHGSTLSRSCSRALARSTALCAALAAGAAGCLTEAGAAQGDDLAGVDEAAQESRGADTSSGVTPLPGFADAPNIQQAASLLASPTAIAVVKTVYGFQIYRCEQGATAPEWRLRTPLAVLVPHAGVQRPLLNAQRLAGLVGGYHYRSDFGELLAPAQVAAIGLGAPATAPVWDFTLQPAGGAPRHEVVAGRVLAQDASPDGASVPRLLLEVRGRSIDPGAPSALAATTHLLRWSTRGGLAPAAADCTAATLGRDRQVPYSAEYFFLRAAP